MNIRFLTAGVFLIAAFSSNAYALSIAGWGFKIGSIAALFDLKGVPNPDTKPTEIVLKLTLTDIEVLCVNPVNKNVAPGQAGIRSAELTEPITWQDLESGDQGKVSKPVYYKLDIPANQISCNKLWTPVPSSAAAKSFAALVTFKYEDTTKGQDVVNVSCVVKYPPIQRSDADGFDDILGPNPDTGITDDYAPIPEQEYECKQTTP